MAVNMYDNARSGFLLGTLDWDNDTIKLALLDNGYTFHADDFDRDDSNGAGDDVDLATIDTGGTEDVTGRTDQGTQGTADAADVVFNTPPAHTSDVDQMVMYKHVDGTKGGDEPLIVHWPSANVTNFPLTLTGGNVTIQWQNTGDYIFTL